MLLPKAVSCDAELNAKFFVFVAFVEGQIELNQQSVLFELEAKITIRKSFYQKLTSEAYLMNEAAVLDFKLLP